MKPLTKKQIDSLDNLGFKLDWDNMNELLKIVLTKQPPVDLVTREGIRIHKEEGEEGSFYIGDIEIGKLAGMYAKSPESALVKIVSKARGYDKDRIVTWYFLVEETKADEGSCP